MEGYSSRSLMETRAVVLMRLRERFASCAAALQYCCQAAGATLQLLWARAYQLFWSPVALRERETRRNVGTPQAPETPSKEDVARKREQRIAINRRIVELQETDEKKPEIERCFLEVFVKTILQFTFI